MIDVRIRAVQSPAGWISREMLLHVFVNIFLQIDRRLAKRAHDHIRANAGFNRHVTVWIFDLLIRRIVAGRLTNLIDRVINYQFEIWRTLGGYFS